MTGKWDFYRLLVDGQPASVFLDMGIAERAPVRRFGCFGYLRVHMQRPREDGLSSSDEFEALNDLEDAVTKAVTEQSASVYVGRNTSSGNRDFYFYAEDAVAFEAAASASMAAFPRYGFDVGSRPDPDWRTYFDFLYPSPLQQHQMSNRAVVRQLEKRGDDVTRERRIDHLVVFADAKDCQAFSVLARGKGFSIPGMPKQSASGEFRLEFSKEDKPARMDAVVAELFTAAAEHNGTYDGWGCEVVA